MRPMEAFSRPGVIASRRRSGANPTFSASQKASKKLIIIDHYLHSVAIGAMLIPYNAWYGGEHEPQPKK